MEWRTARERAHASAVPLGAQSVPLREAAGLTLAADLVSSAPMPAYDSAAMDGFAVCEPGPFRLVGEAAAGLPFEGRVLPGEAVRISTGAAVPAGATRVLRAEDARSPGEAGVVASSGEVVASWGELVDGPWQPSGMHVRSAGEDAAAGEVLAVAGSKVTPAMLGLAASAGRDHLKVHPAPRVLLLVTGDEVIPSGTAGHGLVRDALGPMLPPLVAGMGGRVVEVAMVRDRPAGGLARWLDRSAGGADVVVVTGSTSVGCTDQLREELARRRARVPVGSVACRPGHPQLLAVLDSGGVLVGLPGNPFAAFVAAWTLLSPLLAGLSGRALPPLRQVQVEGEVEAPPNGVTRLVPVSCPSGTWRALGGGRPAFLVGAAMADGLAAIDHRWKPGGSAALVVVA
ncbi:MAG: molybdopterin molybdotransferase MoeA [Acidimicrobiales bacterium]